MFRGRRLLTYAVAGGSLMLSACGQATERVSPRAAPVNTDAVTPVAQIAEEWLPRGINEIVWSSYIGLIGTVASSHEVDVAPPYINYTDITLTVEQVLYTNKSWEGATPSPGGNVQFAERRPGDGASIVGGLPSDVSKADRYGPPLPVGTRVVVMMSKGSIDVGPGHTIAALQPSNGYQSIWTAGAGGLAVSVQPSRTVQLDKLLARVKQEHERGPKDSNDPAAVAEDETTVNNPLGEPVPTTTTVPVTKRPLPTLPEVVASPEDVTLGLDARDGKIEAMFRGTAAGGVDIAIAADGVVLSGTAGPTAASEEGRPLMVNLPSGETLVALVGAPGLNVDKVQVSVDGGSVAVASGTWNREGARPVVAFIVPKPPAIVKILGLVAGPAARAAA